MFTCSTFIFVIDRLHHYLRKLMTLRKTSSTSREEVEKLQMENRSLREKEEKSSSEMKKLQRENAKLNESMKKLKSKTEENRVGPEIPAQETA